MLVKTKVAWIKRQWLIRSWRKRIRLLLSEDTIPRVKPFASTPLIIIGMHRSGTSLLTRLLHQCGVFMGNERGIVTDEAIFFRSRNEAIFSLLHVDWDEPIAVQNLLAVQQWGEIFARLLWEDCRSGKTKSFVGRQSFYTGQQLDTITACWGWKDPRNTFTLPLWLQIFPHAKVLHIVRNGVDVSRSLHYRETVVESRISDISLRSQVPTTAFDLWAEYVEQACRMVDTLPTDRTMTVQYEALLAEPEKNLIQINKFIGNNIEHEQIISIAKVVKPEKAWAFLQDNNWAQFYRTVSMTPLMRKFGYETLPIIE